MIFNVMTLFPESFNDFLSTSIIGRSIKNDIIKVNLYNIRDYSLDKNKRVDDYVYGGGKGMLISVEPIYRCYKDILKDRTIKTIYLTPKGSILNNKRVKELASYNELIILCGHYEGIDERVLDLIEPEEISIGDFVLTGGELASMVLIDSVSRFIDGVLSNSESSEIESFNDDLLEYPQYTRPIEYMGLKVPDVLTSGNHQKIRDWRLQKSIEITKEKRPDLYKKFLTNKNMEV